MSDKKQELPDAPSLQHEIEKLQERASKDTLSGLLNRGTAELYINQRLQSMAPEDVCALFIIDLDDFKRINDTLGHQAGDQAIRQSARILSGLFRAADIVGRLGGDEFIVFISGQIKEPMIRRKGQEICQQLQLALGNDPRITMTASVGIYFAAKATQCFDDLYQSADLALYKAKKNGKHGFFIKYSEDLSDNGEDDFLPVNTIPLGGLLEYMDSGVALLEMGDPIRLIYVSPSFCRIIGADVHTYTLPKNLSEVIYPDDLADLEQALRKGLTQDNCCVDHTHRVSADGKTWLWWHIRAVRIEYSNPHPVMLVTATDVSHFKEHEHALREVNGRLQSAFEQTTQGMWEVDLASRTFTLFRYSNAAETKKPLRGAFPDFILSKGWIHPSSVEQFRIFAQEILDGRGQGYGNFVIQYQDTGCYGWATLSYQRLSDDEGADRAVGIIEKLPREFGNRELHSLPKRTLPTALTPYLIVLMYGNLSRDSVQKFWLEGKDLSGTGRAVSCSAVLGKAVQKIFSEEERQPLGKYFDREQLLELFSQGERWIYLKYRRVDQSGAIGWVNQALNLVQDPLTQDVYLYTYLIRTDICRQRERELGIDVVRDSVTGLYDRATVRALVECQIGRGCIQSCAAAVVHLGGLNRLYTGEDPIMRRNRCYVATAISAALGPQCIIGQYGKDELLVFFPSVSNQQDVQHMLEEAFSFARIALAEVALMDAMRFVAGAAVCDGAERVDYGAMTAQCAQLCRMWRNAVLDTVVFAQESDDCTWNELQRTAGEDRISVCTAGAAQPLAENEKDAAFQGVSAVLPTVSLDDSVSRVRNALDTYCRALGVEAARFKECLDDPSLDRLAALKRHLAALEAGQEQLEKLIRLVKDTIGAEEYCK